MSSDRRDPPDRSEPFLSRWSRRKQGAGRDGPLPPPAEPAASRMSAPARPEPGAPESEPPFDLASLPSIEELTSSSSVEAFLQKGVPEELKRLALRKAWSLDPAIREFIEVAENQYDWNVPGGAPGFGELNPGADLSALLDQAMGRVGEPPKSEVPPTVAISSRDAEASPVEAVAVPTDAPLGSPAETVVAPGSRDAASRSDVQSRGLSPVAATAEPTSGEPSARRRRHGGALPTT